MPEHTVKFKFDIEDKVTDPFGNICIVDPCSLNGHRQKMYYVDSKSLSRWMPENQLTEFDVDKAESGV